MQSAPLALRLPRYVQRHPCFLVSLPFRSLFCAMCQLYSSSLGSPSCLLHAGLGPSTYGLVHKGPSEPPAAKRVREENIPEAAPRPAAALSAGETATAPMPVSPAAAGTTLSIAPAPLPGGGMNRVLARGFASFDASAIKSVDALRKALEAEKDAALPASVDEWNALDVARWASRIRGVDLDHAFVLLQQEVTGKALVSLTEENLLKHPYNLPGGPAIRIAQSVAALAAEMKRACHWGERSDVLTHRAAHDAQLVAALAVVERLAKVTTKGKPLIVLEEQYVWVEPPGLTPKILAVFNWNLDAFNKGSSLANQYFFIVFVGGSGVGKTRDGFETIKLIEASKPVFPGASGVRYLHIGFGLSDLNLTLPPDPKDPRKRNEDHIMKAGEALSLTMAAAHLVGNVKAKANLSEEPAARYLLSLRRSHRRDPPPLEDGHRRGAGARGADRRVPDESLPHPLHRPRDPGLHQVGRHEHAPHAAAPRAERSRAGGLAARHPGDRLLARGDPVRAAAAGRQDGSAARGGAAEHAGEARLLHDQGRRARESGRGGRRVGEQVPADDARGDGRRLQDHRVPQRGARPAGPLSEGIQGSGA